MRDWSNILNHCYLKTCSLQCTDCGFTTLTGTLYIYFNILHAVFHSLPLRLFRPLTERQTELTSLNLSKPSSPALAHETALPCVSEIVTIVLLNVDWICVAPFSMCLRSRRRRITFLPPFGACHSPLPSLLLLISHGFTGTLTSTSVSL